LNETIDNEHVILEAPANKTNWRKSRIKISKSEKAKRRQKNKTAKASRKVNR